MHCATNVLKGSIYHFHFHWIFPSFWSVRMFSFLVTMAYKRRAIGSRTGDSKKEVECGMCTNPRYKARRDYMKATHFPLKHPGKPCKEKRDQTLSSLPKFNPYQPPRQQFVLQICNNFRFYAHLTRIWRCRDLCSLSGKFLREKSCCPESFFFTLTSRSPEGLFVPEKLPSGFFLTEDRIIL